MKVYELMSLLEQMPSGLDVMVSQGDSLNSTVKECYLEEDGIYVQLNADEAME